jgi:hypothetical protein
MHLQVSTAHVTATPSFPPQQSAFLLAAMSPSSVCANETLKTLRYAHRARNIFSCPVAVGDVVGGFFLRGWGLIKIHFVFRTRPMHNNIN